LLLWGRDPEGEIEDKFEGGDDEEEEDV